MSAKAFYAAIAAPNCRHKYELTPHMLLEEIFPVAAYYQDTWREGIQRSRHGSWSPAKRIHRPFEEEFKCEVRSLLQTAISEGRVPESVHELADRESDGLVGWMLHRN